MDGDAPDAELRPSPSESPERSRCTRIARRGEAVSFEEVLGGAVSGQGEAVDTGGPSVRGHQRDEHLHQRLAHPHAPTLGLDVEIVDDGERPVVTEMLEMGHARSR